MNISHRSQPGKFVHGWASGVQYLNVQNFNGKKWVLKHTWQIWEHQGPDLPNIRNMVHVVVHFVLGDFFIKGEPLMLYEPYFADLVIVYCLLTYYIHIIWK